MRRTVKGVEEIILEDYPDGGFMSIEAAKLTMKMSEVFSEDALVELADRVSMSLTGLNAMTFIAFLKSDIAGKDVAGWRQHRQALRDEGFDV